ncbi:MerR family transcriptional regulator [Pseudonocardia sp. NPDC046786]|uniref:MerR family transcriptional regulator n=1 Tax=Pseudonocardia sp. NPDC046786 TaxID=3155471 RepID=UPI0033F33038
MRIGTVAELTGVTVRLLRYYEERGLLHPRRGYNGYREYTSSDVDRVRGIRWLMDTGMPTSTILHVAHCVSDDVQSTIEACPDLASRLGRQREDILENIRILRGTLARIESSLGTVRGGGAGGAAET